MKHLTNVCVIILLIAQSVFAQIVEIPDPQIEVSLREALKLSPGTPITKEAMLQLTVFAAEVASIENITGLEYAEKWKRQHPRFGLCRPTIQRVNITPLHRSHPLPPASTKPFFYSNHQKNNKKICQSHLFSTG